MAALEKVLGNDPSLVEESLSTEEGILLKHKKERKELQSKIISLKKSSAKADKKKKKEVLEEIANIEIELEKRQALELANLKTSDEISQRTQNIDIANDSHLPLSGEKQPSQRISKAQKRRDKKCVKSKERNEEISAQEAENVFGARNVETQKIKAILKQRGLMIEEIPSDGNCLYCAVDYQWQLMYGTLNGLEKLRSATSEFLRANASQFLPFMTHPETDDMLTETQYEEYCDLVANTPAWGGEVELRALSSAFKCPIEVIQAVGPSILFGEEFKDRKTIVLTYHRHMYGLGEHYNSVKPYEEPPEDEECQTG